jgi:glycosyltransferase involved in cell wall biosynthesis
MNILVLAAEIPATSSMPGSPRLFNLCRLLAKNHRLSLITGCQLKERRQWFTDDCRTAEVFQAVTVLSDSPNPTWWNKQRHRLHLAPHFQTQYLKPDYHQKVLDIIHERLVGPPSVDLIYVDGLGMTQYAEKVRTVPVVVDLHDSLTLLYSRSVKRESRLLKKVPLYLEKRSIAKREQSLRQFCRLIITNSEVDEQVIKSLAPSSRTLTVTNGVDVDYFASPTERRESNKLIFTGVMDYGPNEDAVLYFGKEIFPKVRKNFPAVEFWVVGSGPSLEIRSLASEPGVHVTGRVDDIRPYLESAGIFVCPLRYGAGMKNKVLAAMAMRTPVLATPISLEGIEVTPGKNVLVADSAEAFAKQIDRLLTDRPLARHLAEEGYKLVAEKYSWMARGQVLESILMHIAAEFDHARVVAPPLAAQALSAK